MPSVIDYISRILNFQYLFLKFSQFCGLHKRGVVVLSIMDNITKKRKEMGISQKELAALVGVSESAISKWKTGDNEPSMKNLKKIADVLNCSMSELTEGIIPLTGFESEADFIGAANDAPEPKEFRLGEEPPTAEEIVDLTKEFYSDSKLRALFRMRNKVGKETFRATADAMIAFLEDLKGYKENGSD